MYVRAYSLIKLMRMPDADMVQRSSCNTAMPMDALLETHLKSFVLPNVNLTGTRINAGPYSDIDEVRVSGTVCVAKRIHDFFLNRSDIPEVDVQKAMAQFVEDCRLMNTLHHPNVVQFLGVCFFPDVHLPALVMERMQTSLHDVLSPAHQSHKPFFLLGLKCSILHNVASGLAFLHDHCPPVLHCHLSAHNVLLTSGMVAKIADVRASHIVGYMATASATRVPVKPDYFVYMPRDALPLNYTSGRDIFSLGVISVFTLSQMYPRDLLKSTYAINEESSQQLLKFRSELEGQDWYVDTVRGLFREGHPLIEVILQCLHDDPKQRPIISKVQQLLEEARAEFHDENYDMNKLEFIRFIHNHIKKNNDQQLNSCEIEKQVVTEHLMKKAADEDSMQATIRKKQCQSPMSDHMELNRTTSSPTRMPSNTGLGIEAAPYNTGRAEEKKLTVQCYIQKPAKFAGITRGSAVIDGNFAYFTPRDKPDVYRYNVINGEWIELPNCPHPNAGLVITDIGSLVAVGGEKSNKLFTFCNNQWIEEYPPMTSTRSCCAVLFSSFSIRRDVIVVGGNDDAGPTSRVDLLDTASNCWYELPHLPQPHSFPSAVVCDNFLHVIGTCSTGSVGYSCSLQNIICGDKSQSLSCSWTVLPHLPVHDATAATLRRQLIIVGGRQNDTDHTASSSIHQMVGGQWVHIGSMCAPRQQCLVVSPSPDKVVIVGGVGSRNSVELCHAE